MTEGGELRPGDLARQLLDFSQAPGRHALRLGEPRALFSNLETIAQWAMGRLPAELDYMQVPALSIEVRQKLNLHRPETLGQASRISGVTPAAISLLLIHLKKGGFKGFAGGGAAEAA